MHVVVLASYLSAGAAFLVVTVLLALSWRGQRTGAMLLLASATSLVWACFLAWADWYRMLPAHWVLLAEVLRYGAWLMFVSALFGAWPASGALRGLRAGAQALWIALALYCLLPAVGWASFRAGIPLVGVLLLALFGLVFLEQILRNTDSEQRWAIKFLLIALGGMFAYDIFLYSYALLYHQFNASTWAARGFVDALLAPLLLVAAARNRDWSVQVGVSRRVVFYSTSLLVVAFYIIATAVGGYYVRVYGGDWGRVVEIALMCFALLIALLLISSGRARAQLRLFLYKNFFTFRHDYREHWLQLTTTLGASDSNTELPVRAVQALAQTMDSPAGALWMHDDADALVARASWNLPVAADFKLSADAPVFPFLCERRWIYDLGEPPPFGDDRLRPPAALCRLPQAWLLVPLVLDERLIGVVLLAQARARRGIDWEDIDLLRTAGSQVAGTLMQASNAEHLAEARQFEGFNRLTAFLMHDLKNVAAQQSLLLENAARHKHNPAFVDDMLETVDNSVRRIRRLLEQLRGDAPGPSHARVRVAEVIGRALDECRAQQPVPEYQSSTDEAWVRADAEQLATALEHLVRNAQDAATPAGRVALGLACHEGRAVITIGDNGPGMDPDFIRDRLFKPFFTTKASKGMGIGAHQAREYVRTLGGALEVQSRPGEGTVFTLRLPLASRGDVAVAPETIGSTTP